LAPDKFGYFFTKFLNFALSGHTVGSRKINCGKLPEMIGSSEQIWFWFWGRFYETVLAEMYG
jgi:hypothetical protein